MKKNYSVTLQVQFSLLLLLLINFNAVAQSRGGKNSVSPGVSKRISATNLSKNGTPNPVVFATDVITACGSYTWPVNGQTYTASGIYTDGGGITQIFNDETAWNNSATANGATVSTNNMAGVIVTDPIVKTIGGITVTFSATGGMYSSGTFIGTANPNQNITITFSPAIYGIAGNFFTTNVSDAVISGNVTATYSDGAIESRTVTTDTENFGYFSTTPLTSLVLSTTTTVPNHFISLNNISIATSPTADDTLDLTIIPEVNPTFPTVNPICAGNPLLPLPTTSDNGVTGTWSPALDNMNTTTYIFTPDTGQCASTKTITITVYPIVSNSRNVTACNSYTWPITGTTYTTSGTYTTTIPLTDTAVINDVALWNEHALSFNSTISFDNLVNLPATNPTNLPMGGTNVTFSAPGGMYSGGNFIGTGNPNNPLTIAFNPPVYGVLANFFTTDINDDVVVGNITVNYSNGTSQSRTVTTDTDNFGYFDNNLISSVVISSSTVNRYISVKNIRIATNPTSCSTEELNLTINTIPPPGSSMATAIEVNTPNYSTTGNNLEINCYTDNGGELSPDVWYKVTLDACAQNISLNTCTGSNFDTILTVYASDGTTELAYSDDDCPDINSFQSAINDLDVSGEDVVYVMVEGYYGLNNEQGTYGLEITQTLAAQEIPTFTAVNPICNGDALAALPTTSNNGIPGTWSPTLNNTLTTTYTFTPNTDQCAATVTLDIIVNQPVTPTFAAVAPICNGDVLTALPTTSLNGYTGTWSPALNNTITTTYTFTPDAGQCAATATLEIIVNQPVTPTFAAVAPICNGDALTALPTTSDNGYTGSWSPALDNTITTTYTFTPDAGQCATTTTLEIIVNQPITPTFAAVAPICNGEALTALPTTSLNGYTGTWSPALDNTVTTIYTFTPDAGQCATTASLSITVNQPVTPTFNPIAAICNGDTLAALPITSVNGYTGNWSPALDNTITTTYTFTPTTGQCATSASLTITVNQPVTPSFTPIAAICNGDSLSALPTTSVNGYTGVWSPALDNTTTTTYTFTPDAGQCAATASLTITVNQPITPIFTPIAAICNGDALTALPTTSINGYTGTWSPALNNTATTTYTFTPTAGQCATTTTLEIIVNQPITPTFDSVAAICNGDTLNALPITSVNGYTGTWSPALDNTATTIYTFTPDAGQCATTASLSITVNQPVTPTFNPIAAICNGDTLNALPITSANGYTGTWSPALDNTITTTYTFTPDAGQCAATASLTITVNQPVTPTFTVVNPICTGDALSPLPTTSNNGYTGTWSPALNNTTTTTYTFTPDAGQCAATTSLTITVNQPVTPTFAAVAAICNGDTLTALPTTSINGYTGTWSPALNNTATTTYIFTPNAGQCATTTSLTISVNQPIIPIFSPVAPICNGDNLALPATSDNGYTGTWSPALDNTATTNYTFTPDAGQCASTASLTVTVNQPITPSFDPVASICNGDALNALPTTSNNGYTGTWSPALNNTATTTYTFTPDAGQCASTASLTITVDQPVIPTFDAVAAICNGDALSALPTTSNNGYTGTWSPTLDNTITTIYTFTPDAGQCAATASLTITVNQPVTPTFTAVNPICAGDVLVLPTTSENGYTGIWSPAFDNTATTTYTFTPDAGQCATTASLTIIVNQPAAPIFDPVAAICSGDALVLPTTATNGYIGTWSPTVDNTATTTYTFTPDAGQCATTASLTVMVNQPVTPTFTPIAPICNGDTLSALPTTSDNGYTGTWSPALNNTATTTYTFTPDSGQCAATTSLTITVNQPIMPTFDAVADICNGDALDALPTTSVNGYTGTWSPALDNTITTTYTFTPDSGQCAATASLTITVNQPAMPTFTVVNPICTGDALSQLPTTSNNGYTGTWSPALDNTVTTTYTFTPDAGQCAAISTLTITVNQVLVTPTFTPIAPICNGDTLVLPTTSDNGFAGSWTPAADNTATTTYTFTPNPGQCGTTAALTVTVNQPVTPIFDPIAPICNGDAVALPSISNNGIPGTWSPALDNTATTSYTFTPNAGQCATTASLTITVNQPITPTFATVAPICNGETLNALPITSNNGYSGTWSPALDNTVTTTYTFTPDAGQCAVTASLTITVNQPVTPTFLPVAAICNGDPLSALPTTSTDGISGTWSPALNNTATTTYTFTPDAGQCASTATMIITVHATATPTGNPSQTFDVTDLNDATLADLVVNPTDVNWYASLADAESLNDPLPLTTVLTNGATYYAVAFSATCPSEPFAVTVNVNLANPSFEDLNFNYYPNPTSSVVNISCSINITKVTLVNMLGQIIMTEDTDSTLVQVDLSRLAEATYFVKVMCDDREKVIKVVKRR